MTKTSARNFCASTSFSNFKLKWLLRTLKECKIKDFRLNYKVQNQEETHAEVGLDLVKLLEQ